MSAESDAPMTDRLLEIVGVYLRDLEMLGDLKWLVPDECLPLLASTVSCLEQVEQILEDEDDPTLIDGCPPPESEASLADD